jgi:outer membrane protein assembly factor BamD
MKTAAKLIASFILASALLQGCATPPVHRTADEFYKEGEQLFQDGNYGDAIERWKKVKETYQSPDLTTKAELNIANAYFLNKDYIEAAAGYEDFRKMHPKHPQADFALYRQGLSNFHQIHGIDTDQTPVKNALASFASYLKLYPDGAHRAEAEEKYRECRDKEVEYELYVGHFYLRTDAYKAAIGRFEEALKQFPDSSHTDELLYELGRAYLKNGQEDKGRETLARLVREFPASTYAPDAARILGTK